MLESVALSPLVAPKVRGDAWLMMAALFAGKNIPVPAPLTTEITGTHPSHEPTVSWEYAITAISMRTIPPVAGPLEPMRSTRPPMNGPATAPTRYPGTRSND